jgi:hypothetical protein
MLGVLISSTMVYELQYLKVYENVNTYVKLERTEIM